MKRVRLSVSALALTAFAVGALVSSAQAAGWPCPDYYAPVKCSNGKVYLNPCYAMKAGATGCVPFGGE